jgi:hypothetical protein
MEIMIAAVVFAIVAVAIVSFLHWGRGHIVRMGMRRNALALTEEKLEELRGMWIDHADLADGGHGPEAVQISKHHAGSRTWSVTWQTDPVSGPDYKEVVLGVAWSWEGTKHDSVSLVGRFYP